MPVEGIGPHRIWYTGGRYAYASIHFAEFGRPRLRRRGRLRPDEARGRRPLVDPGHVAGRRRDGDLAPRASGTRSTTRWWPALSPTAPGATGASPFSTWPIRPAPSGRRIATGTRPSAAARIRRCRCRTATCSWSPTSRPAPNCRQGLRYVWVFDVREPGNPGQHRDLSHAVRGGLLRQGRQLRPPQPAREPARLAPELAPDLRHLLQRRRARLRHRRTRSSRARSGSTCRPTPSAWSIRARTGRG